MTKRYFSFSFAFVKNTEDKKAVEAIAVTTTTKTNKKFTRKNYLRKCDTTGAVETTSTNVKKTRKLLCICSIFELKRTYMHLPCFASSFFFNPFVYLATTYGIKHGHQCSELDFSYISVIPIYLFLVRVC